MVPSPRVDGSTAWRRTPARSRVSSLRASETGSLETASSSGESVANSIWAKTALPMRLPPRLLGQWVLPLQSPATHQLRTARVTANWHGCEGTFRAGQCEVRGDASEPSWFSDYRGRLGYIGPRPVGCFPPSPDGGRRRSSRRRTRATAARECLARTHALARISGHHALHRASSFPNLKRTARGSAAREPILPPLCRCADRRHEGEAGCRASPPWQADRLRA